MTGSKPGAVSWTAAAARAAAANKRADQLRQRRVELASGMPASVDTVERAQKYALESLERAKRAHRDAAVRHLDAGAAHRRAAAIHEQAAVWADDDTADAHQEAAASHRAAASYHEAAAVQEEAASAC